MASGQSILGSHLLDLLLPSASSNVGGEIASIGNEGSNSFMRFYDLDKPSSNGYVVGLSNQDFIIMKQIGQTEVGIGTSRVRMTGSTVEVAGTLSTSNITTYNSDSNVYFGDKSVAGIQNISFSGQLMQGGAPFKTSQWTTTGSNIYISGSNVGIGTASPSNALHVIGDAVFSGTVYAFDVVDGTGMTSTFKSATIYAGASNGTKTLYTNATTASDRVLFSISLLPGRYLINASIPFYNLSGAAPIDSVNWAQLGIYKASPATFTNTTDPIYVSPISSIGVSTTELESAPFNMTLIVNDVNGADFVLAVSGKGHQLQFGNAANVPELKLYAVPLRGLGVEDPISTRQAIQINAVRQSYTATAGQTMFSLPSVDGYFSADNSNADVYVNGTKLRHTDQYAVAAAFNSLSNLTVFSVATTTGVNNNDKVDIAVWPYAIATDYYKSGYLYQNITNISTPWLNVAGGGVRTTDRAIIDGDLYVKGNIYGGCNTTQFAAGVQWDSITAISCNVIGTLNIMDGAVTPAKIDFSSANVGIGTTNPQAPLHVVGTTLVQGNILPTACNVYDIGSAAYRFKDLYLSGSTINLDGLLISKDATTGGLKVTDESSTPVSTNTATVTATTSVSTPALTTTGANINISGKSLSNIATLRTTGDAVIGGNITASNLTIIGDFVTLNTMTSNTEQMVITNAGTGPALKVTQTGANSIAEFYDNESGVAMFIANGANVGIGTTYPLDKMHVNGSMIMGSTSSLINNTTSGNIGIGQTFQGCNVSITAASDTAFYYNNGEDATIAAKQFSIIGANLTGTVFDTTAPIVASRVYAGSLVLSGGSFSNNGNNGAGNVSQYGGSVILQGGISRTSSSVGGQLSYTEAGSIMFLTGSTDTTANTDETRYERMRVDGKTGNVGIGTTAPLAKFHVEGTAYVNGGSLTLGETNNTIEGGELQFTVSSGTASSKKWYIDSFGSNLRIYNNVAGTIQNMFLTPAGNIGIGTDSTLAITHIFNSGGAGDTLRLEDATTFQDYEYPPSAMTANTTALAGQTHASGTYTASSSTVWSNSAVFYPWKALNKTASDGNDAWISGIGTYNSSTGAYAGALTTGSPTVAGEWLQLQLPESMTVKGYIISTRNNIDGGDPKTFTLFGSTDGSTWVNLNVQTNVSVWGRAGESRHYAVTNSTAYTYYRLVVTAINPYDGVNYNPFVSISEWKLFGTPSGKTATFRAGQNNLVFPKSYVGVGGVPGSRMHIFGDNYKNVATYDPSNDDYSQLSISTTNKVPSVNWQAPSTMRLGVSSLFNYGYLQMVNPYIQPNSLVLQPFGGSVGIGTIPQAKLHVQNTTSNLMIMSTNRTYAVNDPNSQRIVFATANGTLGAHDFATISATPLTSSGDGHAALMTFCVGGTSSTVAANTKFLEASVYTSGGPITTYFPNGNVGIGFTNPSGALEVYTPTTSTTLEFPSAAMTANTTGISGTSYGTGSYVASSSTIYSAGFEAYKGFNKTTTDFLDCWVSSELLYNAGTGAYSGGVSTAGYAGEWVQLALPKTMILKSYSVQARNDATNRGDPKDFRMYGSNDGSTWTLVDTQTNAVFTSNSVITYSVTNTTAYLYYRLVVNKITSSGAMTFVSIGELRLYGTPTQGTSTLFVANGNVGIGTVANISKLHVWDGTIRSDFIQNDVIGQVVALGAFANNFGTYSSSHKVTFDLGGKISSAHTAWGVTRLNTIPQNAQGTADFTIDVRNNAVFSEALRIKADGNVGIGITNPSEKLHVNGGLKVGGDITNGSLVLNDATSTNGSRPSKGVYLYTDKYYGMELQNQHGTWNTTFITFGGFNWKIYDGSARMYLTNVGDLGIGTTNPLSKLHIKGAGSTAAGPSTSTSLGATLTLQDSGADVGNGGMVQFGASQGIFAAIKGYQTNGSTNTQGRIIFSTRNAAADATLSSRMEIDEYGTVTVPKNITLSSDTSTLTLGSSWTAAPMLRIYTGTFAMTRMQYSDNYVLMKLPAGSITPVPATEATLALGHGSTTGRSISASGTVVSGGADFAEYMTKSGEFTVAKGDIVGIDTNGLLTNVYADSITFVVKSTQPVIVGGDTWANDMGSPPSALPDDASEEEKQQYTADMAIWNANLEARRITVDRIAFSGQAPVNVYNATLGSYIVPIQTESGGITGIAVNDTDITFDQYRKAVGKVIKIQEDGRAFIIVKVA